MVEIAENGRRLDPGLALRLGLGLAMEKRDWKHCFLLLESGDIKRKLMHFERVEMELMDIKRMETELLPSKR
ncbi:hypothetical protein DXD25_02950 [Prevotella sp. TF12-30]|nr:hypothetical protein DXD25_02950 [Prevotella sp. TF12-30]